MTTTPSLTLTGSDVKTQLEEVLRRSVDRVLASVGTASSPRALEEQVVAETMELGRQFLEHALAARCWKETSDEIARRGLDREDVTIRFDEDYVLKQTSVLGPIRVPLFAYRDYSRVASVTRTPALATLFPYRAKSRSTELCIEWQARLAAQHPFRKAQELLCYSTHGAVRVEDTTIERHAVRVGHLIDQEWLYRSRDDIAAILRDRAAIDVETRRPIIHWSCDAHALRRYVNESWTAAWKMVNAIRLWCVDRRTGATIHIGGEFTCGDAHYTRHRVEELLRRGIIPADGDFGDGLVATYVFVSDGMPWFEEHIMPLLPTAIAVLDLYHVIERWALAMSGKVAEVQRGEWPPCVRKLLKIIFGAVPKRRERLGERKGHTKRRGVQPKAAASKLKKLKTYPHSGELLLAHLARIEPSRRVPTHEQLVSYIQNNSYRMDYRNYRARNIQIGSGAMESMHRTGSQERLKRAGARWLPETLEAMLRLRMLEIVGRWSEWWAQPDLRNLLANGFTDTKFRTRTGPQAPRRPTSARPSQDRANPSTHQ